MKRIKKALSSIFVALFWLTLWYIFAMAVNNPLIFPTPAEVGCRLFALTATRDFWIFTALSLLRIALGIFLAIPAAVSAAAICSRFSVIKRLFSPAVLLMKSTPVVSFILIAIFIFDREIIPSAITFIMIFPVLYGNVCEGISRTPMELIEMAKLFRIPLILRLKNVYLPAVSPYFFTALTTSVGLAIKAGVAAEVVAYIPDSVGKKLSDAKSYMEPADLLAWTAVIIVLSLILEKSISFLRERRHANVADK
jgi:NitT/TauT family transport system permease protein